MSPPGEGVRKKASIDLMNRYPNMSGLPLAPRCSATAKATGLSCRSPAVNGWTVCRMHGAGGGAPSGRKNGNYRHGWRTKEAADERRYISSLLRTARELIRRTD